VTTAAEFLCASPAIDAIIDITGSVEYGASLALQAFAGRKHLILVNAELDATLGPVLKNRAMRAGVVVTNTDGDEPGVAMNLIRYLRSIGMRPVAAGNLKGMIDPYRTPATQKEFAAKYDQNPSIVASFADGTKLAMECNVLANASGFGVAQRGMIGPRCGHVKEIASKLPLENINGGGLVDYALGAEPGTGAFVVVRELNAAKKKLLNYLKMGNGPMYVFYTPYHLPHIQIASTIARAVLLHDATIEPMGPPVCEVITLAKKDLAAGEILDGVGGFAAYGVLENRAVVRKENLLPMGLSGGCTMKRPIGKDRPITFADVTIPPGRLCDELYAEQLLMAP
jgi:predicted homoserine dehydrogenase-like protein